MAPKPPALGAPRRSLGAPRYSETLRAPTWPPNPQRSERRGGALALLDIPRRSGPRHGPQTPNARSAAAEPWRSSISRDAPGPEMAPKPPALGAPRPSRDAPRYPETLWGPEMAPQLFKRRGLRPPRTPPGSHHAHDRGDRRRARRALVLGAARHEDCRINRDRRS